uniref:Uncharacterized protein n=1 Tax=Octopus bimaculoides TaxID=37653 RepID=A0A0L8GMF0_OCTBM
MTYDCCLSQQTCPIVIFKFFHVLRSVFLHIYSHLTMFACAVMYVHTVCVKLAVMIYIFIYIYIYIYINVCCAPLNAHTLRISLNDIKL